MLSAVDQSALIAERQLEDRRLLQIRPLGLAEASSRRRKHLVAAIFLIGVQAHPFIDTLYQADLLCTVVFILLTIGIAWRAGTMRTAPRDVMVRCKM